jgi:hypothetical protein
MKRYIENNGNDAQSLLISIWGRLFVPGEMANKIIEEKDNEWCFAQNNNDLLRLGNQCLLDWFFDLETLIVLRESQLRKNNSF